MATFAEFSSVLNQSRLQTHVWHLQTEHFSEHMALGAYYEEIVDLLDALTESYQGCYGRVTGYTTKPVVDWKEGQAAIYFKGLYDYVEAERQSVSDATWIQNQIDQISELIASIMYKLTLKG